MKANEFLNSNLRVNSFDTMQVNLGDLCNLSCKHCHVEASPKGSNIMDKKTADLVIEKFKKCGFNTLDLTGGAPEMNPNFRYIIQSLKNVAKKIIVRTNLTILCEKDYEDLPKFFADNKISLVASLPCYTLENVDKQRGKGVFDSSIKALKTLNSFGYGKNLELNLAYNPGGAFLPGDQNGLEKDYKKMLFDNYGIVFTNLFTITNTPIGRFKKDLQKSDKFDEYMRLLNENFNEATISNLMCKSQISVGFDGYIYNCDFNQMLGLKLDTNLENFDISNDKIILKPHCLACTAGAGSSCGGALK